MASTPSAAPIASTLIVMMICSKIRGADGKRLWQHKFRIFRRTHAFALAADELGVFVAGSADDQALDSPEFILRMASSGCMRTTAIRSADLRLDEHHARSPDGPRARRR